MARYVANRLAQAVLLLVIVSAIGFALLHLAPGGPLSQFAASAQMTQEDLLVVHREMCEGTAVQHRLKTFGGAGVFQDDVVEECHRQLLAQSLLVRLRRLIEHLDFEDV